jgi:hypothetical protein
MKKLFLIVILIISTGALFSCVVCKEPANINLEVTQMNRIYSFIKGSDEGYGYHRKANADFDNNLISVEDIQDSFNKRTVNPNFDLNDETKFAQIQINLVCSMNIGYIQVHFYDKLDDSNLVYCKFMYEDNFDVYIGGGVDSITYGTFPKDKYNYILNYLLDNSEEEYYQFISFYI